jgi:hypothetical protein
MLHSFSFLNNHYLYDRNKKKFSKTTKKRFLIVDLKNIVYLQPNFLRQWQITSQQ